jgi:hypothetical protein
MQIRFMQWIVSVCVIACWSASAVAVNSVSDWTPDQSTLDKLADPQPCGGYVIRPPKHYTLQTIPVQDGSVGYAWVTDPRADGTHHYILAYLTPSSANPQLHTVEDILGHFLSSVRQHQSAFKVSQMQVGTINGLVFFRQYWAGIDATTGQNTHGFIYAARDGRMIIEISSQDIEPYSDTSLPLTEASTLTFRKLSS